MALVWTVKNTLSWGIKLPNSIFLLLQVPPPAQCLPGRMLPFAPRSRRQWFYGKFVIGSKCVYVNDIQVGLTVLCKAIHCTMLYSGSWFSLYDCDCIRTVWLSKFVCLSVCPSNACIVIQRKKLLPTFYTIWKNDHPNFPPRIMVGERRPIVPEISSQTDPVPTKTPIFSPYSVV